MKKLIIFLLTFTIFSLYHALQGNSYFDLLSHHAATLETQLNKDSAMCFCFANATEKVTVGFMYHNGQTGIVVDCTANQQYFKPASFAAYKQKTTDPLTCKTRYVYPSDFIFPDEDQNKKMAAALPDPSRQRKINQIEHLCSFISVEECEALIKNKTVAFYTGAGISADVVPTMNGLFDKLGLEAVNINLLDKIIGYFYPQWIYKKFEPLVNNPEKSQRVMHAFYQACFDGTPTPAHYALTALVAAKNCAVITENIDTLQQKAGVECLTRAGGDILQHIDAEQLKNIDVIICIGMSEDQSGLLYWYKELYPKGIIVALDRGVPCYVGHNDKVLRGDIQTIVPELAKSFMS